MKKKTVIVITGLPTSGKSSLGRALAKKTGLHFVDIDEGPAHCVRPQEPDSQASEESRAREGQRMTVAYTVLHAAVEANLHQGNSLIICATYSRHANQDFLEAAVRRGGGTTCYVLCTYNDTPEEVGRRITERVTTGATGGCRSVEHYFTDKGRYMGIKFPHLTVMMDEGETGIEKAVLEILRLMES